MLGGCCTSGSLQGSSSAGEAAIKQRPWFTDSQPSQPGNSWAGDSRGLTAPALLLLLMLHLQGRQGVSASSPSLANGCAALHLPAHPGHALVLPVWAPDGLAWGTECLEVQVLCSYPTPTENRARQPFHGPLEAEHQGPPIRGLPPGGLASRAAGVRLCSRLALKSRRRPLPLKKTKGLKQSSSCCLYTAELSCALCSECHHPGRG